VNLIWVQIYRFDSTMQFMLCCSKIALEYVAAQLCHRQRNTSCRRSYRAIVPVTTSRPLGSGFSGTVLMHEYSMWSRARVTLCCDELPSPLKIGHRTLVGVDLPRVHQIELCRSLRRNRRRRCRGGAIYSPGEPIWP